MTSTSTFDRWEKDPFFSAAEEVQESADRMESIYRRWIHERKEQAMPARGAGDASGATDLELNRELHTALGTAKWQLEEFDRASRSNIEAVPADDDARIRHSQFVAVIGNQILMVENSLREIELEEGGTGLTWVRLDKSERDELALFLSCPPLPEGQRIPQVAPNGGMPEGHKLPPLAPNGRRGGQSDWRGTNGELRVDILKSSFHPIELSSKEDREVRVQGHRRAASVGTDPVVWKISVSSENSPQRSLDERPDQPPPKVHSFSGLAMAMESTSKMKWAKNGFRKWKGGDQHQASESIPLQTNHLDRGLNVCYEKSKSCLSSCSDESYDKQLYGWLGAFQRQLQRSQYQIQYGRPVQVIFWVVVTFLLIVLFMVRAF